MSISINDLKRLLETILGCEPESGRDHVRYVLKVNGKIIARTKFSHSWRGSQQISETILRLQAQQMHCSTKTWKLLLQGRLKKEEYFKELLQGKFIDQSEFDILCGKESSDR